MIGWLLDTDVIAELIRPGGSVHVKAWAMMQNEATLYLSILTIGEYDKGIANLADDDMNKARYIQARDALELRFTGRILSLEDPILRRWGAISGRVKRETGHAPAVIDTLLAATAIERDLYLVSRNVRDVSHSGAAIFDPWRDDVPQFPLKARPRG